MTLTTLPSGLIRVAAAVKALLDAEDEAAIATLLGLDAIGTDQLSVSANVKSMLDAADNAAIRTSIGTRDYEANSWVPTVTLATPGTFGVSYASQVGRYVRFGDLVYAMCQMTFTPTVGTGTGNVRVSLPFAARASDTHCIPIGYLDSDWTWPAGVTMAVFQPTQNAAFGTIRGMGSATEGTSFTQASLSANQHILHFAGIYERVAA